MNDPRKTAGLAFADLPDLIPPAAQGGVVAIGNFDGLHGGHRALLAAAKKIAVAAGAPLVMLTFEPHPREFFQPDGEGFRLTLLPAKQRLAAALGVDAVVALSFNADLAAMTAGDFIDIILKRHLAARHVVTGADFAFGHGKTGHAATLRAAFGDSFTMVDPVACDGGTIYSSTRIRDLLRQKDFAGAAALLGHAFTVEAPVIHGDKRGRTLGYPTANQRIDRYVQIPFGVYAVDVAIGGKTWRGAANFGRRPMFETPQPLFETHILGFDGDLYGQTLAVTPLQWLRGEAAFDSLDALCAQMKRDCEAAAAVLRWPHA